MWGEGSGRERNKIKEQDGRREEDREVKADTMLRVVKERNNEGRVCMGRRWRREKGRHKRRWKRNTVMVGGKLNEERKDEG